MRNKMKKKRYKCFICGRKYKESNITPLNYYDEYLKKWSEIIKTRISYCDEHLPLCPEHLRIIKWLLVCHTLNENGKIDIDGEHINE